MLDEDDGSRPNTTTYVLFINKALTLEGLSGLAVCEARKVDLLESTAFT